MIKKSLTLATALLFLAIANAKTPPDLSKGFKQQSTGISFTENKGQVHNQNDQPRPDVMYGVMAGNMAVHIKNKGVSYQLSKVDKFKEVEDPKTKEKHREIDEQSIYRIDLTWLNANADFTKSEDETLPGYSNYYLESCPNGALKVKSYKGITLHDLYKGIDLHYYEKKGELKHDYIVAPQADYKQIQLQVEGAEISINKDGSLLLTTPLGKIQEGAPLVYQDGKQLVARWLLKNNNLSFEIEKYDSSVELIIDPITRVWGTYYGGTSSDNAYSCATDASNNVYLAGATGSGTSIATTGSHQSAAVNGGGGFLAKFTSAGVRLWATYYGGGNEKIYSCAADVSGNVFIAGTTGAIASSTLVATVGSHQPSIGGSYDAFLAKFDANGVRQWGTYYGDLGVDYGYSCATDASGNVFLAGYTSSATSTVIATPGSHQPAFVGGTGSYQYDAFLAKFDGNGVRQWGTYYGGGSEDYAYSCSTDASGNVYLGGSTATNSGTNIATPGSYQAAFGATVYTFNAFLAKFDAGGVRQWGTYYGTNGLGNCCVADANGDVYLTGSAFTTTGTIISTPGSHQPVCGGGEDAFLVKFNASGTRLWGTYYGGTGSDRAYWCTTDASNNVYLAGLTYSITAGTSTAIATAGSYQTAFGGGQIDAMLIQFNSSGIRQWGTFYGGTGFEDSPACAADLTGNVYLSGFTSSTNTAAMATNNGHQSSYGGSVCDAFLAKFKDCTFINPVASSNSSVCSGASINLNVSTSGTIIPTYSWSGPNSFTSALQNPGVINISTVNVGVYTVAITNDDCVETATLLVKSGDPTITINSGSICPGKSFTINPGGAPGYTYSSGSPVVSPLVTTSYTVTGTNTLGCAGSAVNTVVVNNSPTISVNNGTICSGKSFTIIPAGAASYTYSSGSAIVSPVITSSYSVTGTSSAGCVSSNTAVSVISVIQSPAILVNSGSICAGQSFTINASGASSYSYSGGPVVTPNVTSSYTITGTNTLGCSGIAVSNVIVNPIPTISVNNGAVCIGKSFTIIASGASTYTYSNGPVISPIITNSYSVTGTSAAGCAGSNTAVSIVTVNSLPNLSAFTSHSLLCIGESATLTASGASTYTFNPGGVNVNNVVAPGITTTYTVTGTDTKGCSNTAVVTQNVDACTGLKENSFSKTGIRLYPNPGKGLFNLETDMDYEISVVNAIGQVVYSSGLSSGTNELNLEHLAKGIYVVKLYNATNSKNIKLIKE